MYKKAALIFPFALMSQLSLADWVKDAAQQNENQVIQLRQHIHQNPELGNMEFKTSALVQKELKSYGIQVKTGYAKTGVVGILKGNKPGPIIALRADMDAYLWKKKVVFHLRVNKKQFIKVKKLM
jgi:Metal-dependent amidase/aminoacylase/carboxypeptidase